MTGSSESCVLQFIYETRTEISSQVQSFGSRSPFLCLNCSIRKRVNPIFIVSTCELIISTFMFVDTIEPVQVHSIPTRWIHNETMYNINWKQSCSCVTVCICIRKWQKVSRFAYLLLMSVSKGLIPGSLSRRSPSLGTGTSWGLILDHFPPMLQSFRKKYSYFVSWPTRDHPIWNKLSEETHLAIEWPWVNARHPPRVKCLYEYI